MSEKEPIRGKVDDSHHDGRRSDYKRRLESEAEIAAFWAEMFPEISQAIHRGDVVDAPSATVIIEKYNLEYDQ